MPAETLKGHLDLLLLAIIAAEPAHGYRIIEQLKRRSGGAFNLAEGTVYPALHRLEQSGLLSSSWATGSGRRRRVYRATARGRRALAREQRDWRTFTSAVEAVVT
jgi:PadR family transcriptional regulator, regulatory protein PadR